MEEGPRQAQPLALAAGEGAAQLAHRGVVALGQAFNKLVHRGHPAGPGDFFVGGVQLGDAQVGPDAVMEQVYEGVVRRYPDFDVRNYGYTHLDTFVENNVSGVKVYTDENGVTKLTLVDDREEIDTFAYEYMTGRGYKIDDMAELLDAIRSRFPGFAMENYGYHTDYGFILSFSKFEIWENKGIKMKRTFKLSESGE